MPSFEAWRSDTVGQTATIGFLLMIAITLIGVSVIVMLGGTAVSNTETSAQIQRAQLAMTMFDAQASQVAVGGSAVQTVELGGTGGTYHVDPDTGTVTITHLNYTGTGDNATILQTQTLGAVVYETAETTIAYQGGGVWRTDRTGDARMISPPEVHYRGSTLTFPIIVTRGEGAASGTTSAVIEETLRASPVYPNGSAVYPNGDAYANPIENGTVVLKIESRYSRAWGKYFEDRTSGDVTYPDPDTVRVELVGVGDLGAFEMPGEGGSIAVPGAEGGHSVDEFTITIRPDDKDAADFNNLQWSMYAEEGDQQFELHLTKGTGSGCSSLTADATIYYSDDGGSTYHGWHHDNVSTAKCKDFDGDGDDEIYFEISLVDDDDDDGETDDYESGNDANLTYQDLSSSQLQHFGLSGATVASPASLDGHGATWEEYTANDGDGDELTTDMLLNHYFGELPNEFALTVDDQNSDSINEDASSGVLHTTGTGKFVTYLHATENHITVRLG